MAKTFIKLTRPEMRQRAPGGKINEHGITFEKSAAGDGVFTVNIMAAGQRIHRVVGRESDGTTRTQAEAFIEKVRSDAKNDRLALPKGRKVALAMHTAVTCGYVHLMAVATAMTQSGSFRRSPKSSDQPAPQLAKPCNSAAFSAAALLNRPDIRPDEPAVSDHRRAGRP